MALRSQGTLLKAGDGAQPTESFTSIFQITGFRGPDGQAAEINTSHLESTRVEIIMGLADEGSITAALQWDPSEASHAQLIADRNNATLRNFEIHWTSTPVKISSLSAFVLRVARAVEVDQKVTAEVTLRITGEVVTV